MYINIYNYASGIFKKISTFNDADICFIYSQQCFRYTQI